MNMNIEVQHTEAIKPSFPTPDHLHCHMLSFLDQIAPPVLMPLILFYPKDEILSNGERCDVIKQSLSEALTRFYPLAGRVTENAYVKCNDEGAHYVEAKVRYRLSDVLENPTPQLMNELLPIELHAMTEVGVFVQVNEFDCGGLGVCLCISHKIADALSFFTFLNSWAAIARGDTDIIITPCFDSASLFPPIDISGFPKDSGITTRGIITRRFVFEAASIAALRAKYTDNDSPDRRPTRVEALSVFIWSRYVVSTTKGSEDNKIYTMLYAVNLRSRMNPALSEHNFGNISRIATLFPSMDAVEGGRGHEIVNQAREAIRQVDSEHVMNLQQGEGQHLNFMMERYAKIMKGEVVPFSFTSLCRFPMYEADFGWGKPAWIGSATFPFKNVIVFLDTKSGDGIEAWCNLKEEDMAKFVKDEELLTYASPNSGVPV